MMPLTVSKPELLVNGEDHLFRQVIHDALGFSVRLQEIRNRLGEAIGLTGPAYSILIAIEHLSEGEGVGVSRSEEHTSELQSLMRISYAVFCLQKKKNSTNMTFLSQFSHI